MREKIIPAMIFFALSLQSASAAECSSGNKHEENRDSWLTSKVAKISGKTFVNRASPPNTTGGKAHCSAMRTLSIGKHTDNSDSIPGAYSIKSSCHPQHADRHEDASFDIKIKKIHWTDIDSHEGWLRWERSPTRERNQFDGSKDKNDSGVLCFLHGGRISVDGYIYYPQ